ncbi:hypothetical protein [Sorangium cellulosum]|uniref:hypothetical protein n=1 Tax=Sorangium cellulosum TaxID=56 RepID=UPI000CF548F4|nr:hypothetical protein [Sorangium cellulosum]
MILGSVLAAAFFASCDTAESESHAGGLQFVASALCAQDRLAPCDKDPRVIAGLIARQDCAVPDGHAREAAPEQGRSCGSCHGAGSSPGTGIHVLDVLLENNPFDPAFLFGQDPAPIEIEIGAEEPCPLDTRGGHIEGEHEASEARRQDG